MPKSKSYKPLDSGNIHGIVDHCNWLDNRDDEPCWGQVEIVDSWPNGFDDGEGESPVYGCKGHSDTGGEGMFTYKYTPEA